MDALYGNTSLSEKVMSIFPSIKGSTSEMSSFILPVTTIEAHTLPLIGEIKGAHPTFTAGINIIACTQSS